MKNPLSSTITMEDKNKQELSTPDVPSKSSSGGNRKSQNARHKKKNKGGKTVTVVSSYTSSPKELKVHIFTTESSMHKTFLLSREKKFLGYATTKFGNDVMFSLSKQRVALMHMILPTAINHTRASAYE